jgi:hypothetical protein
VAAARERGYWKLLSRVFPSKTTSRALCGACGFREVGIYEKRWHMARRRDCRAPHSGEPDAVNAAGQHLTALRPTRSSRSAAEIAYLENGGVKSGGRIDLVQATSEPTRAA